MEIAPQTFLGKRLSNTFPFGSVSNTSSSGYTKGAYQFSGDSCGVISLIHEQSQDINRGVDREEKASQEQETKELCLDMLLMKLNL